MLPFLRRLSALSGGCESFLRAGLALAVFQERGLIALSVQGDQRDAFAESHPGEGGSLRLPLSVPPAGGRCRQEWRCCVMTIQEQYEQPGKDCPGLQSCGRLPARSGRPLNLRQRPTRTRSARSGEPYIIHPLAVAQIVAEELRLDSESIEAALLHDVIEDTAATHEQVSKLFSPTIADLVEGVSKLTRIQYATKEDEQMENLRKMLIAMSKDIRVILIKISDRLHNMRTMEYQSPGQAEAEVSGDHGDLRPHRPPAGYADASSGSWRTCP